MFEVFEKETPKSYLVYGVKAVNSVMGGYNTLFLIYENGKWIWEKADRFEPLI